MLNFPGKFKSPEEESVLLTELHFSNHWTGFSISRDKTILKPVICTSGYGPESFSDEVQTDNPNFLLIRRKEIWSGNHSYILVVKNVYIDSLVRIEFFGIIDRAYCHSSD